MDFTIRKATAEDYKQVQELFDELIEMHAQVLPSIFHSPDDSFYSKQKHTDYIAADDKAVFVAEQDGRVMGALCARIERAPRNTALQAREYAYIEHVAVEEASRHNGVGQALMEKAHHWARDRGMDTVELNVKGFNERAIGLYKKLGYTIKRLGMWKRLG